MYYFRAESKEPLISDRILTSDNPLNQSKGKTRGLTAEEVLFTKLAEERVQESLSREQKKVIEVPETYQRILGNAKQPVGAAVTRDESSNVIDQMLGKAVKAAPSQPERAETTDLAAMPPIERKSAFKDAVLKAQQQPTMTTKTSDSSVASINLPVPPPSRQVTTISTPSTSQQQQQSIVAGKEKKLNKDELEIAGEALQAIVKHRYVLSHFV